VVLYEVLHEVLGEVLHEVLHEVLGMGLSLETPINKGFSKKVHEVLKSFEKFSICRYMV
jgi:hypothetical protein